MKHAFLVLILSFSFLQAFARPHHHLQEDKQEVKKSLAEQEKHIVNYISLWHPEASQEEQEQILLTVMYLARCSNTPPVLNT